MEIIKDITAGLIAAGLLWLCILTGLADIIAPLFLIWIAFVVF